MYKIYTKAWKLFDHTVTVNIDTGDQRLVLRRVKTDQVIPSLHQVYRWLLLATKYLLTQKIQEKPTKYVC